VVEDIWLLHSPLFCILIKTREKINSESRFVFLVSGAALGLLFNGIASIISGITGNARLSPIKK